MPNVTTAIYKEDGVSIGITYNNSRVEGTNEFGEDFYLIRGVSATNTTNKTFRIEAKQGGVLKYTYLLLPQVDVSANLPSVQQWTTYDSSIAVSLVRTL
jgi:hypothetical protein